MVSKHDHASYTEGVYPCLCCMKWLGKLPLPLEGMLGHHSINTAPRFELMIVFVNSSPAQSGDGTVIDKYIYLMSNLK